MAEDRARGFLRALTIAGAASSVPHARGILLRSPAEPEAYVGNQLLLERSDDLDARGLIALLDELQAGAGHRRAVLVDEDEGARLHATLLPHGWGGGAELVMVLPAHVALPPSDVPAVSDERLRAIERRTNAEMGLPADVVEQLVALRRRAGAAVGARGFVAVGPDGEDVAHATLYGDDRVFQIEDVATLVAHRGRGYARAVVAACARDARARGAEIVFLTADADDWPQRFYAGMGFVPDGHVWVLQREGLAPDQSGSSLLPPA